MIQKRLARQPNTGRLEMIRCRLAILLGERKMHITDLQRMTGVSYPVLWKLYQEKSRSISFSILEKICNALDCKPGELITNDPENS